MGITSSIILSCIAGLIGLIAFAVSDTSGVAFAILLMMYAVLWK